MATIKINLNGETVPFTCFAAGADVAPNISLSYNNWPEFVVASNIDNVEAWQAFMAIIFEQCLGANTHGITYEQIN